MNPLDAAKHIPKGRAAASDEAVRVAVLNAILLQLRAGQLGRGERTRRFAATVGLADDRPKKLVAWVKGGGGTSAQLRALEAQLRG